MEILTYLTGVLLLVTPTSFLLRGHYKVVPFRRVIERPSLRARACDPVLALNLARSWLGTELLGMSWDMIRLPFAIPALVLGLGLVLQQCFYRDAGIALPAPVAWVAGVALGILPLCSAAGALVIGFAAAIAFRSIAVFHIAGGICLLAGGLLMNAPLRPVCLATIVFVAPVLLSALRQRTLGLRVVVRPMPHARVTSHMRDVPFRHG
ncbi:hypothetical protein OpiT1DRAFT_05803 [Opitutaceae bacterium TAV1]|nr:hypothetical protein OPIT5_20860 [Opitutaceae bacterium TAV5]EIQ01231.1 hypothetical protein OpiT1DRAFT_05803 [Opitutaceae bacterium TAV1]